MNHHQAEEMLASLQRIEAMLNKIGELLTRVAREPLLRCDADGSLVFHEYRKW